MLIIAKEYKNSDPVEVSDRTLSSRRDLNVCTDVLMNLSEDILFRTTVERKRRRLVLETGLSKQFEREELTGREAA